MKIVISLQAITALAAVVALTISLTTLTDRLAGIQRSRYQAAIASCQLLRTMVNLAANTAPAADRTLAMTFLDRAGLHDCRGYARHVISGRRRR